MVFISYSHDSDEFCDKVLDFSNYLRENGVDANIDQYEECPPQGWPRWMEEQIRIAEYVLVVCSPDYEKKATLKVADTVGLGTKWESNLILNALYATGVVTNKFIPVIFDESHKDSILEPLKGLNYYNLQYEKKKENLRDRLLGIKNNKKPPLGTPKCEPKEAKPDARLLITGVIDVKSWDKATWKGVGYSQYPNQPPILGLVFQNPDYAKKIFSDWNKRFNHIDKDDEIYISIIEDDESPSYSIHIGADFEVVFKKMEDKGISPENIYIGQLDRWHRMQIVDKQYLERFKKEYSIFNCYILMPMIQTAEGGQLLNEYSIIKKKIHLRKFSELKKGDYDFLALELRETQDA